MGAESDGELEDEEEDKDSEEDEEDMDHDEIILGNTTDVIISMAAAFGDGFLPYLKRLGPILVKYQAIFEQFLLQNFITILRS